MRILWVKSSSLGDIIHSFPAISDALAANAQIRVDWVVEEHFTDVLKLYREPIEPIPVALRRWRRHLFARNTWKEFKHFRKTIQTKPYDLVIDAQGLVKSACLLLGIKSLKLGMNAASCREPLAAYAYNKTFTVARNQHAVMRTRELMAKALDYPLPTSAPDYAIKLQDSTPNVATHPYIVFIHGSSWPEKAWPLTHWQNLAKLLNQQGYKVKLPWGNTTELHNAQQIAKAGDKIDKGIEVLPKLNLTELARVIYESRALVAVDTGLAHLAAAMDKPCVSLYLVTSPLLTGCYGRQQVHLAVCGQETPHIKKLLAEGIQTPIKPLYLDKVPDYRLVYQHLSECLSIQI